MVKDTVDVIQYLLRWDFWMFPGIDDARGDILQDCSCNLTGRFVENIGKVVFRQERMGRIGAVGVGPRLVLVFPAGIDYV